MNMRGCSKTGVIARAMLMGVCAWVGVERAGAVDVIKENNSNDLNLATSWVGGTPPGASDVAVWDNTVTAANTTSPGADLIWQGIRIANPGGNVIISTGFTMTIGAAGIDLSESTRNLTISSALVLDAAQTWSVSNAKTLFIGGRVNGGGNELTISHGGVVTISSSSSALMTNVARLTVDAAEVRLYQQTIGSVLGELYISGTGTVVSGANQAGSGYSVAGVTVVSNGTLDVFSRSTVTSASVVVHQDGIVRTRAANDSNGRHGWLIVTGGFTNFQGASEPFSPLIVHNFSAVNVVRGRFDLRGDASVFAHPSNTNAVRWAYEGAVTGGNGDGEIILGTGYRTVYVSDGGAPIDLSVEPRVTGAGGLTKTGPGVMELLSLRESTYAGGTIVSAGTLLVNNGTNGSGLGSGPVSVESGGTLGGAGQFTGAVTNKSGGTIAPGSLGVGMLTTGPLTMESGSTLAFDIGSPWVWGDGLPSVNDLLVVNGDLALDGQLVVDEQAGFGAGTYTIAAFTGGATDAGIAVAPLSGGLAGAIAIDHVNKLVNLVVSASGPPPSIAGAFGIVGADARFVWSDLVVAQLYQVAGTTNLLNSSWTNLASFSATGSSHAIVLSGIATQQVFFFRLEAE